ncbi:aminotransferase class I/II-fold pyridoxal phosphate-dependent enzyme [Rhodobacteraceae bacterium B1Z28]|uniref:Aminotransferase class I/II-fold pyridoxal phosphate-dependent enzyme n=1 Tax=Ruegeria haliotis TaxID=2747601 RepID=A0ABX2PQW9_9RHOB|nr:aminotransferase class I/II-fold pyridoxal phosphate-dependent enzyme [Ruegeria haliotis]NVO56498.1 aminotransferase class I/II-fold pyridoxal phosphate-dependent enzyme [Ruegeria haliotis]
MTKSNRTAGIMTTAIHAGDPPDASTNASAPPIHMSSTYITQDLSGFSAHDLTPDSPYAYSRWANPTVAGLEAKIAALQGTEACLATASGMAAASAIFFTFLSAGDHLVVSDVSYAGVAELARETLPRMGVEVSAVNMSDPAAVADAIRPNTCLIHTETPVNPIGRLTDLAAISNLARRAGALLSCDATFASPLGMDAVALGVDLTMHSITKYIGGHGDAVGGAVAGSAKLISKMRAEAGIHHGGILSPFNAWLIARGATTLPLRMQAHQAGAMAVAEWLEADPRVTQVIYPGLSSHPQADLAKRQMSNMSGMISFQVGNAADGERVAQQMIDRLEVIHYAVSLGHHRSLIFWMGTDGLMETSFRLQGPQLEDYRAYAGDGIFRLSVGLEDAEDLIGDLDRALG